MESLTLAPTLAAMAGIGGSAYIAGKRPLITPNPKAARPNSIRVCLSVDLTSSGSTAGISMIGVPGLLVAAASDPQAATRQWKAMYSVGKVVGPAMSLVSLTGYGILAYSQSGQGESWKGYLTAGLLTVGLMPFTVIVMTSTNDALLRIADGGAKGAATEQAVTTLLKQWRGLNMVRSIFPLCGFLVGFWSLLH